MASQGTAATHVQAKVASVTGSETASVVDVVAHDGAASVAEPGPGRVNDEAERPVRLPPEAMAGSHFSFCASEP